MGRQLVPGQSAGQRLGRFVALRFNAVTGIDQPGYDATAYADCDRHAGDAGDVVQQPLAALPAAAFLYGIGWGIGGDQPEFQSGIKTQKSRYRVLVIVSIGNGFGGRTSEEIYRLVRREGLEPSRPLRH